MKVKDIMTKKVIFVAPKTKVTEIAEILLENKFNGVPVVDRGEVVGLITEADLITKDSSQVHIPSLIKILEDLRVDRHNRKLAENLNMVLEADARSVMDENFVAIGPEADIADLSQLFKEKDANPVPVVDESKKLLGIVSKADVLSLLGKIRKEELDFLLSK